MIKYSILGSRPKEKKENLFYYDLREYDDGDGYTIEKRALVNNIGCLITDTEILKDKEFVDGEEFEKMEIEETIF